MADSNIVCSGLTATGGIGQIALEWQANDATDFKSLAYMQLDRFEVWASASNNRASATKIGEVANNAFLHTGLAQSVRRYYWVRARDRSGNLGDWFPLSATAAGVTAITSIIVLPNSVGTNELEDDAVTNAKIKAGAVTAESIAAGSITAQKIAALAITAEKIAANSITGNKLAVDTIEAGNIKARTITTDEINIGGVWTTNLTSAACTAFTQGGKGGGSPGGAAISQHSISVPAAAGGLNTGVLVIFQGFMNRPNLSSSNFGFWLLRITRNGTSIATSPNMFYDDNFAHPISWAHADSSPGTGTNTYVVTAEVVSGPCTFTLVGCQLTLSLFKR